jgi:hypothetical protein
MSDEEDGVVDFDFELELDFDLEAVAANVAMLEAWSRACSANST